MLKRYPITGPQYNFWVDQQIHPESPIYNIGGYADVNGALDHELFERVINALLKENDALRIRFSTHRDGTPYQYFHPYQKFPLQVIDYSNEGSSLEKAKEWINSKFKIAYKLNDTSLFDIKLIKIQENHYLYYFKFHHMILDGWGTLTALKQVIDRYNSGKANSEDIPLGSPSYIDFIEDDIKYQASSRYQKSKKYWKEKFSSVPESILSTPLFKIPSASHSKSERYSLVVSSEDYEKLNCIAHAEEVTIFNVILANIYVLLHKLTRLDNIVIGVPLLNRNNKGFKNTIGLFVETSPLQISIDPNQKFSQLLVQIKKELTECYRHQRFPAGEIAQQANTNTFSRLLDVSVSFEQHTEKKGFRDYDTQSVAVSSGAQNNALSIYIREYKAGSDVVIDFDCRPDIFNQYTMDKMLAHFTTLYKCIINNTNRNISHLNILSGSEKNTIRDVFNGTKGKYASQKTMVDLFEEQVAETPELVAVVCNEISLTYRELNSKANIIAHSLRKQFNITADDLVGVMLNRSEKMVISILGILKSGGAYVPIDSEYPKDRIEYMIKDAAPKLVITQEITLANIELKNQPNFVDISELLGASTLTTNPVSIITPANLAYVIYTSGSTGKPKGVMIEHRSVSNISKAWKKAYNLSQPGFSLLQIASFSFDVATGDIIRSLHNGGKLVITEKEALLDPESFANIIIKHEISILEGTPKLLIPTFSYLMRQKKELNSLKTIILGSDVVTREDFLQLKSYLNGTQQLVNSYGVTEATIDSTYFEFTNTSALTTPVVSIGSPFLNTQIYVLDDEQQIVPIGVPGELCISGEGLARGYLNKETLTSEKFVDHPFVPGGKMYRTGDLARWLPEGNIDFLGRLDDQVKIRGYRIELGEIENTLLNHSEIKSAVVAVKSTSDGDTLLAAYFESDAISADPDELRSGTEKNSTINPLILKKYLSERLPPYMVPSYYQRIEKIPLTTNGKVNRKFLPEPILNDLSSVVNYVKARTKTEEAVIDVWQDILQVDRIGIHNNFFDLGGHSLKAIQIVNKINRKLECALTLKNLFDFPDVERLSYLITNSQKNTYSAIIPTEVSDYHNVSHTQKRLWLLEQLNPGSVTYNMPGAFILRGEFNEEAFNKSFDYLVSKHEILRTVFITIDGQPKQKILNQQHTKISIFDLRDQEGSDAVVASLQKENALTPFNLELGPLIRFSILRIEEEKYVLLFNMHHIISDGWSLQVFFEEFLTYYNEERQDIPHKGTPLGIQYKDYSTWQHKQLDTDFLNNQKSHWLEVFKSDVTLLDMPSDFSRPARQTFSGHQLKFKIQPHHYTSLLELCRINNASLFMGLHSLLKVLIHRYTGQEDITLGTVVSGRGQESLHNQIGFYANTLPLRDYINSEKTFEETLELIRVTCINAYANQDYPFDKLVDDLSLKRDISRSPLFDIFMVLQNKKEELSKFSGLTVEHLPQNSTISKFDMTFDFYDHGNHLECTLEYNTDIYSKERMERLSNHFNQLINSVIDNPKSKLRELEILSSNEKNTLITEFNKNSKRQPIYKTIIELFEEKVQEQPNQVAISFKGKALSYNELNIKVNKIAHILRKKYSLKPNDLVAVLIPKSDNTVIAILSILKSGAAYIPIDPSYPLDRIKYMLSDASPKLVIECEKSPQTNTSNHVLIEELLEQDSSEENPKIAAKNTDLAYVIYTSGSTGKPKGALLEHSGVVNLVLNQIEDQNITPNDNILQFVSISFDASVFELFLTLLSGATFIIPEEEIIKNSNEFEIFLAENRVSIAVIPPSYLKNLNGSQIRNLRILYTGGDKANPTDVVKYKDHLTYVNAYGPTESSVITSTYHADKYTPESIDLTREFPIGRSHDFYSYYVVDTHNNILPVGIPGELCISGIGLARGYLNMPDLTADKFITNPYDNGQPHHQIMYKTGDLVVMREDGVAEHLGRIDNQIKVRGFRIELGEIENRLLQHENVLEGTVLAIVDDQNDKTLVAFYTSNKNIQPDDLRHYLGQFLADFMIPTKYVLLETLPITPNGKINLKALEKLGLEYTSSTKPYVPPRTLTENTLSNVWQDVLRLTKSPGIDDNFFDLGGDSIKAIQILSKLTQVGYKGEMAALFESPDIRSFSTHLKPVENDVSQEKVTDDIPLTPIQRWFFEELPGPKSHFNQSVMLTIRLDRITTSNISIEKVIHKSADFILQHHDALRIGYHCIDERLVQRNQESVDDFFQVYDLQESKDPDTQRNSIIRSTHENFDLHNGPLIKFIVFKHKEETLLFIVAHHLVIDGVSWRILIEDLQSCIDQILKGEIPSLPLKTVSFKDWSNHLVNSSNNKDTDEDRTYWQKKMATPVAPCPIRTGSKNEHYPDKSSTGKISNESTIKLSKNDTQRLLTMTSSAYNTGINDLLVTALIRTLQFWLNHEIPIAFDLESHGRTDKFGLDVSRTIGWFTSVYPVVCDLSNATNLGDQIVFVKETLRSIPANGIGYGMLKYLSSDCDFHSSSNEISFNYLGQFDAGDESSILQLSDKHSGENVAPEIYSPYKLNFNSVVRDGRFSLTLDSSYYLQSDLDKIQNFYNTQLLFLVDHCCSKDISIKTPSDFTYSDISLTDYQSLLKNNSIDAQTVEDIYTLTPLQQGLLFHALMTPGSPVYFEQLSIDLEGDINLPLFEKSWKMLAKSHSIFRTAFLSDLGTPLQMVLKHRSIDFNFFDIREDSSLSVDQVKKQDRQSLFDLKNDPLCRIQVVQTNNTQFTVILSFHHIILDGWCTSLMFNEVLNTYKQLLGKNKSSLLKTHMDSVPQYAQYISWLNKQDDLTARHYWQNYLNGYEQLASVPKDDIRISCTEEQGLETLSIDSSQTEQLKTVANNLGVTMNTIVQSIWGVLLGKYNRTDDVVFGSTVSGRPQEIPHVDQIIGLFINTIPVRINSSSSQTLSGLIKQVQADALATLPYHHSSLADIQSDCGLPGGLLDHIVVFENYPIDTSLTEGDNALLRVKNFDAFELTNFDFGIVVFPTDKIEIGFHYSTHKYHRSRIEHIVGHFNALIQQVLTRVDVPLGEISILTQQESRYLIENLNDSEQTYPREKSMADLFEEQAAFHPSSPALIYYNIELTYADLNRQSNKVAHYLQQEFSIGLEDLVALALPRSEKMIIALLGILKSGAAYVPIDPEYPQERIDYILSDSKPKLVISDRTDSTGLSPFINLDSLLVSNSCETNPIRFSTADSLAYIIYTSGSTGKPKGVMLENRGVVNLISSHIDYLEIGENERSLQFSSICFDASIEQIWVSLLSGSGVVLVSKETILSESAFNQYIYDKKVTYIDINPSYLENIDLTLNPYLKRIVVGGEKCPVHIAKKYSNKIKFHNFYGPTETTVSSLRYPIPNHISEGTKVPIGKPVANTRIYILDQQHKMLPQGVDGEIYIAGDGLARGYLNDPGLTKTKFVDDPFFPGEKMYSSGDLGRWLFDGNLDFSGRIDDQIKIRGFRIEPGEVEKAMQSHPSIDSAFVFGKTSKNGSNSLSAYYTVVKNTSQALTTGELRHELSLHLPEYMVPEYITLLDSVPLTSNGKIDKRALPEPTSNTMLNTSYAPPETNTQDRLVHIWKKVLEVEKLGIHDDFFALGGHSLKAMQITSLISKQFNIDFPLNTLFMVSTISGVADVIDDGFSLSSETILIPLQKHGKGRPLFLIPGAVGDVHYYSPLANALTAPVYGFASVGLEGKEKPINSIENMASRYIEEMKKIQCQGPYSLGGHSFGGSVAFEIARQLEKNGETIDQLILIDTLSPDRSNALTFSEQESIPWLIRTVLDIHGIQMDEDLESIYSMPETDRWIYLDELFTRQGIELSTTLIKRMWRVYKTNCTIQYTPDGVLNTGQVKLIRSYETIRAQEANSNLPLDLGWGKYVASRIDIFNTDGEHESMLQAENVNQISEVICSTSSHSDPIQA